MICCDSCPFSPTCEEEEDFLRDISGSKTDGTAESAIEAADRVMGFLEGS